MSPGGVAMQDAFLDGPIDFRNSLGQQCVNLAGVAAFQGAAKFLYRGAQFRTIVTVNHPTFLVLAHSFFG